MSLIKKIATSQLKVSKPIFTIKKENYGNNLESIQVDRINNTTDSKDLITMLVFKNFRENFNSNERKYNLALDSIYSRCMQDMQERIGFFIHEYLSKEREVKNPRATKVQKFYSHNIMKEDFTIRVYKFIHENGLTNNTSTKEAKQLMNLLELTRNNNEK